MENKLSFVLGLFTLCLGALLFFFIGNPYIIKLKFEIGGYYFGIWTGIVLSCIAGVLFLLAGIWNSKEISISGLALGLAGWDILIICDIISIKETMEDIRSQPWVLFRIHEITNEPISPLTILGQFDYYNMLQSSLIGYNIIMSLAVSSVVLGAISCIFVIKKYLLRKKGNLPIKYNLVMERTKTKNINLLWLGLKILCLEVLAGFIHAGFLVPLYNTMLSFIVSWIGIIIGINISILILLAGKWNSEKLLNLGFGIGLFGWVLSITGGIISMLVLFEQSPANALLELRSVYFSTGYPDYYLPLNIFNYFRRREMFIPTLICNIIYLSIPIACLILGSLYIKRVWGRVDNNLNNYLQTLTNVSSKELKEILESQGLLNDMLARKSVELKVSNNNCPSCGIFMVLYRKQIDYCPKCKKFE